MLRKLAYATAVSAALALPADAMAHGGHGGGGHHGGGHHGGGHHSGGGGHHGGGHHGSAHHGGGIMVETTTAAVITVAIIMTDTTARTGAAIAHIGAATATADTGMAAGGGAAMGSARAGAGLRPAMSGSAIKRNIGKLAAASFPFPLSGVSEVAKSSGKFQGTLRGSIPDFVSLNPGYNRYARPHHCGSMVKSSCGCNTPRSA